MSAESAIATPNAASSAGTVIDPAALELPPTEAIDITSWLHEI
ncbi:hypothetical protein [Frondihabitans sucicola]|nr:hypothetical protein [Frondihabitans sucicola]